MTGFAARIQPTTGVHDPIMARALLLDDGATPLAIVSCDLIGFTADAVADMRLRIAQRAAVPAANILIACTHTHSGPASMPFRGPAMGHVDHAWLAGAQKRIIDLVSGLPASLRPARFASASVNVAGLGYNRQDRARPIDEQLGVIAVDADGGAIATLLNYSMHAVVLGPGNLEYSGDYPGEAARQAAERRGGIGLFLLGACGDVDPVVYRDRGWGTGTFDDTRAIGGQLVERAVQALSTADWSGDVPLRVASKTVELPLDLPPSPEELGKLIECLGFGSGEGGGGSGSHERVGGLGDARLGARAGAGDARGRSAGNAAGRALCRSHRRCAPGGRAARAV